MSSRILVSFNYPSSGIRPDCAERTADFFLKPLRLACGDKVSVTMTRRKGFLSQERLHRIYRIYMFVVAIILLPATLFGLLCASLSKTHRRIHSFYASGKSLPVVPLVFPPQAPKTGQGLLTQNEPEIISPPPYDENIESSSAAAAALPLLSASQIIKKVCEVCTEWSHGLPSSTPIDFVSLNTQICAYVVRTHAESGTPITDPHDYLLGLQGVPLNSPLPIVDGGPKFKCDEGKYYQVKINAAHILFSEIAAESTDSFGIAIKSEHKRLKVYLDGTEKLSLVSLNGKRLDLSKGHGWNRPFCILSDGDIFSYRGVPYFTVRGPTIEYTDEERHEPSRNRPGREQTEEFEKTFLKKRTGGLVEKLTTHQISSVVNETTPLQDGFSFFPFLPYLTVVDITHSKDKLGALTFVDLEHDTTLQNIVRYFEAEFELMQYNGQQKVIRLGMFAAAAMREPSALKTNYLLGEIVKAGKGNDYHHALFIKVLADQLDIPCAFVAACKDPLNEINAWCILMIDDAYYMLDSSRQCFYMIGNTAEHSLYNKRYGLEALAKQEKSLLNAKNQSPEFTKLQAQGRFL